MIIRMFFVAIRVLVQTSVQLQKTISYTMKEPVIAYEETDAKAIFSSNTDQLINLVTACVF